MAASLLGGSGASASAGATRGSRSPLRARITGNNAPPASGAVASTALSAAFGLRSNSRSYSRSPPAPTRRGPLAEGHASRSAHVSNIADAALAARQARAPSTSPHTFVRSGSARSLQRVGDASPALSLSPEPLLGSTSAEDLRSVLGEERRRRELAEREANDLRKRLKIANDEVRIWREKCELFEASLFEEKTRQRSVSQRDEQRAISKELFVAHGFDAFELASSGGGENLDEEPIYESELVAIENALDKIYVQRSMLTGDLETIRQRMTAALEGGGKAEVVHGLVPPISGLPVMPAASPRGPVPPVMSPRVAGSSAPSATAVPRASPRNGGSSALTGYAAPRAQAALGASGEKGSPRAMQRLRFASVDEIIDRQPSDASEQSERPRIETQWFGDVKGRSMTSGPYGRDASDSDYGLSTMQLRSIDAARIETELGLSTMQLQSFEKDF